MSSGFFVHHVYEILKARSSTNLALRFDGAARAGVYLEPRCDHGGFFRRLAVYGVSFVIPTFKVVVANEHKQSSFYLSFSRK